MSVVRFPPEPVEALATVIRVPEPGDEDAGFVHLHRNERLSPLPDWFIERLRDEISSALLTTYPVSDGLYRDLSAALGVERERLLLTPGSDAAFRSLCQAYVAPGQGMVTLDPSYAMYGIYAHLFGASLTTVAFGADASLDLDELHAAIVPGVRLVLLANPNQPTGTLLPSDEIARLASRAAGVGALLAVDEAYYPFSRATVLPLVREHANLVVVRTFSKAAGLAGARVGYVVADPEIVAALYKVRSVHDVSAPAIAAARLVLAHPAVADDYVAEVEAGARELEQRARALGLGPRAAHTNFMLVDVAGRCPPAVLVERLRAFGFLVRGPFSVPALAGCIRVTLGPPELMRDFGEALASALQEAL